MVILSDEAYWCINEKTVSEYVYRFRQNQLSCCYWESVEMKGVFKGSILSNDAQRLSMSIVRMTVCQNVHYNV